MSLGSLALAIGWNVWKRELNSRPAAKGVAVLPFENLTSDPDSAYFADGIQEDILARLANIADLKVISRTSTQHYQSKPRDRSSIAKQLGVTHILEGTVRKMADQVRVNVELVNAETDTQLWADTYHRRLTDIVAVESEIARRIAESLQIKLSAREAQALAAKPTNNMEAYDAYLRGLAFDARSAYSNDAQRKAIDAYDRAVQMDRTFALAWARLSRADASLYFVRADQTPMRRDAARRALENAQELDPNLPETRLALGYYQYWVLRDDKATNQVILAFAQRLAGDTAGAKATAEQARNTLKPLCRDQPDNSFFAQQLALANAAAGEKGTALAEAERAIKLLPSARDPLSGPTREEVLALIQIMFGETSRPISTLTRLLQTPH